MWWVAMVFSEGSEGSEIAGCKGGLGRMKGGVEVLMVRRLVVELDKDGS